MRSELVFAARQSIANRFTLCQAAAKATKLFHIANTRIQDTTNDVLQRFASQSPPALRFDTDSNQSPRRPSRSVGRPWRNIIA